MESDGAAIGFSYGRTNELIERLDIEVVPFEYEHVREARLAYSRLGKGQSHPANLNFGDCISYAAAKVSGQPLAYRGDDFSKTDLPGVKLG